MPSKPQNIFVTRPAHEVAAAPWFTHFFDFSAVVRRTLSLQALTRESGEPKPRGVPCDIDGLFATTSTAESTATMSANQRCKACIKTVQFRSSKNWQLKKQLCFRNIMQSKSPKIHTTILRGMASGAFWSLYGVYCDMLWCAVCGTCNVLC